MASKLSAQEISGAPLRRIALVYDLQVFPSAEPARPEERYAGKTLVLARGTAVLAGRTLRSAHLSRTGLHWSERDGEGGWTGVLRFSPDRLSCRGWFALDPGSPNTARFEVIALARPVEYELADDDGGRSTLAVGYTGGSLRTAPSLHVLLDGADVSRRAVLAHVPGSGLRLSFPAPPPGARPPAPADWLHGGMLHLDLGGRSALGSVQRAAVDSQPAPLTWTATRTTPLPEPAPSSGNGGSIAEDAMSVEELAHCDLSQADQFGQQLVQQNMLWAIEQQWIDAFFPSPSPSRPDFTGQNDVMASIDVDCEWYNQQFAPAYLAIGLNSAPGGFNLSSDQQLKLDYYLNVTLGLDIAYNRQAQAVAIQAAEKASPTFAQYVADDSEQWAVELYTYLTDPNRLDHFINHVKTDPEPGMAQLADYATMLTALDPDGTYAQQFYNTVTGALTVSISIEADFAADTDLPVWLPNYIDEFIATFYTGKSRPSDPGAQAVYDIAGAYDAGISAEGDVDQLVSAISVAARTLPPATPENLGVRSQMLATDLRINENWVQATTGVASLLMAQGLYASIRAIGNWSELQPSEQATTITNLVSLMKSTIESLPDVASFAAWAASGFGTAVVRAYMRANNIATLMEAFAALSDNVFLTFVGWLSTAFNKASKTFTTAGTALGELFTGASTLIKSIGPVLSTAAFGLSIWTLVTDIQSDAGAINIAFDVAQTALSGIVIVCLAFELIPGVDVVTTIIAAAAALAGAVLAFAQYVFNLFTEPESSADTYLNSVVSPLIDSLVPPPTGWQPSVVIQAT